MSKTVNPRNVSLKVSYWFLGNTRPTGGAFLHFPGATIRNHWDGDHTQLDLTLTGAKRIANKYHVLSDDNVITLDPDRVQYFHKGIAEYDNQTLFSAQHQKYEGGWYGTLIVFTHTGVLSVSE